MWCLDAKPDSANDTQWRLMNHTWRDPGFAQTNDHPVVGVSYEDAKAFCTWAGKRLCGKPNGGSSAFESPADPKESQWFAACSPAGEKYPYGNTYTPDKCNVAYNGNGECERGSSFASCTGQVANLVNMTGNVKEWEDSCDGNGKCRLRGGGCYDPENVAICGQPEAHDMDKGPSDVGIRCCGLP